MTILTDLDLEFARLHLQKFADSDFFPPLYDYEAIWARWDDFKTEVQQRNVGKLSYPTPIQLPAPKPNATFRLVHQLDPLSCIAYTSLAHNVATGLEASRVDNGTSCSYRSKPDGGSFFSDGTGYDKFLERTKALCEKFGHILTLDIADFYNQIYSHRVRNSISALGGAFGQVASDVESIVHTLNSQASKGIPTGPNASIIFSEFILNDIDHLLIAYGVEFCRFVDDYRLFGDQEQRLRKAVEHLSEYLYDIHRLHLNVSKTQVWETKTFMEKEFFNHYTLAVREAFDLLGDIDYGGVTSTVLSAEEGTSDKAREAIIPFGILVGSRPATEEEALKSIVERIQKSVNETGRCDLNLLKAMLRRCRLQNSSAFFPLVEAHPTIFLPVFHDLIKALRQLYAYGETDFVTRYVRLAYESESITLKFIRYWIDWLASQDRILLEESGATTAIRANGNLRHQASAAIVSGDLTWIRAFRATVDQLGDWDRRCIVAASRILPSDERGTVP